MDLLRRNDLWAGGRTIMRGIHSLGLAVAVVAALGAGAALAAGCKKTNRTYLNMDGKVAVRTVIRTERRGKAFDVRIARNGTAESPTRGCAYTVTFSQPDIATRWALPDGSAAACGDITQLCRERSLTCEKSYRPVTERWNTVLTIED
jgi:hypothetical protein